MIEKFPIDTAPVDDGWILAYDSGRDPRNLVPWVIATRSDIGWRDEDGYPVDPTHWAPLPDPQPEPTGWTKPEGTIIICRGMIRETGWRGWLLIFKRPDGSDDEYRDWDTYNSIDAARARAKLFADRWGLTINEDDRPGPSANVIPFSGEHR